MDLFTNRNILTDIENKFIVISEESWWGRDKLCLGLTYTHYCLYKTDNQQGPTV